MPGRVDVLGHSAAWGCRGGCAFNAGLRWWACGIPRGCCRTAGKPRIPRSAGRAAGWIRSRPGAAVGSAYYTWRRISARCAGSCRWPRSSCSRTGLLAVRECETVARFRLGTSGSADRRDRLYFGAALAVYVGQGGPSWISRFPRNEWPALTGHTLKHLLATLAWLIVARLVQRLHGGVGDSPSGGISS